MSASSTGLDGSYSHSRFLFIGAAGLLAAACSSGDASGPTSIAAAADAGTPAADAQVEGRLRESGKMIDYDTSHPLAGLTVTDGDQTTTTDATGAWTLSMPLGATLSPMVTGPAYTQLFLPDVVAQNDFDRGVVVIPTSDTYDFAQGVLGNDRSLAVVYVLAELAPTCPSTEGGTLTVLSPPGTTVRYFSSGGLPLTSMQAFADLKAPKPIAVIYDVAPGADLSFTIDHPTCKQVPYPAAMDGAVFTGHVTTRASADGFSNSALHVALE